MSAPISHDAFSRALHARVAQLLADDPDRVLAHARRQLDRLRAADHQGHAASLLARWAEAVDQGAPAVLTLLCDDRPEAQQLRQASPFAGLLDPRERWAIWRSVRRAA